VTELKRVLGVDPSRVLDEVIGGEFKELPDNGTAHIKGGEIFVSHVRQPALTARPQARRILMTDLLIMPENYDNIRSGIVELLKAARSAAARNVNSIMTATYWEIGRRIVLLEQGGEQRAGYGEQLIEQLAADLTRQFGRGFKRTNLWQMRAFYLAWPQAQILQTPSGESVTSLSINDMEKHPASTAAVATHFPCPGQPTSGYSPSRIPTPGASTSLKPCAQAGPSASLYAVRLDRLRALEECRSILSPLDYQKLLSGTTISAPQNDAIDEDELMAELADAAGDNTITELRHVRASAEKRVAEEIANRAVCEDFDSFKPLFERVQRELKSGVRQSLPVDKMDEIKLTKIQQGQFFIIGGQFAYVAEVGKDFRTEYDRRDSRLRVIYDNGTESNLLARSFQRSLYPDKDNAGRIITDPNAGPLFANEPAEDDLASGTIYVLRSKSDNPLVAANRDVLHKIGVTGGKVENRLANASLDPTFLLADVEVVATYVLYNVNRVKLENLIHRVFDSAQLDIEIKDRFGNPVKPREWFLVPLFIVDEVVDRIKDGSIVHRLVAAEFRAKFDARKNRELISAQLLQFLNARHVDHVVIGDRYQFHIRCDQAIHNFLVCYILLAVVE